MPFSCWRNALYCVLPVVLYAAMFSLNAVAADNPSDLDISTADFYLRSFEKEINAGTIDGTNLGSNGSSARQQIDQLIAKFPNDDRVRSLKKRFDAAVAKLNTTPSAPSVLELTDAEYHLQQFEDAVSSAGGKAVNEEVGSRARSRIEALAKTYPKNSAVVELVSRYEKAREASHGASITVTAGMLAFRQNESKLADALSSLTRKAWNQYLGGLEKDGKLRTDPLPAPNPRTTALDKLKGQIVRLDGLDYQKSQFQSGNKFYMAYGSPKQRYYYIDCTDAHFLAAYEAVSRYRQKLSPNLPSSWTLVGRISGFRLMVPDPEGETQPGWQLETVAVYIPDKVFVTVEETPALSGHFAGERELDSMLKETFTVRSVPREAEPEEVIRAWITAIKEKNLDLYMQLMLPQWRESAGARERLLYHWELMQRLFSSDYAHAEPAKLDSIETISAVKPSEAPKDQGAPTRQRVGAWIRVYGNDGKQYKGLSPIYLERATTRNDRPDESNRWLVDSPSF